MIISCCHSCPLRPFVPTFPINAHGIGWAALGHKCKKALAGSKIFGYSVAVAANSATGLSNPDKYRCTAPHKRFFCARFMVGCAWEAFAPAGFLYPGLLTCAQFATLSLSNEDGELHSKYRSSTTMKTLSLSASAKSKRGRIAAHKAMAAAALRSDSSLSVRLARYNNHMSKARAIAGGAL